MSTAKRRTHIKLFENNVRTSETLQGLVLFLPTIGEYDAVDVLHTFRIFDFGNDINMLSSVCHKKLTDFVNCLCISDKRSRYKINILFNTKEKISFVFLREVRKIDRNVWYIHTLFFSELAAVYYGTDNFRCIYFFYAQADQTNLNQIGADLVADQVDVIVAVATPTAATMLAAVEDTDIPVVYSAVTDPVSAGFDGEEGITGTSDALNTEAIMNLITAINPDIDTIGLLYDLSQDASTQAIADAKAFCDSKGIKYIEKNGTTTAEVQMAAEALVAAGVKAVFTPTDNTVMTAELSIYETFTDAGVMHFTGADSFALNGAFVGYGVDYVQLGEATADMVVELLCEGKTTADLPYQTFDNGIVTINTESCEALGLDLDTVKEAFKPYCTEIVVVTTQENF